MLKTTISAHLASRALGVHDDEVVEFDSRVDETMRNLSKSKKSKNEKSEV